MFCLGCEKEGEWLCVNCEASLSLDNILACPVCHFYNDNGRCCARCASISYLDEQRAIMKYSEGGLIGKIIHSFKYDYIEELLPVFVRLMEKYFKNNQIVFSHIDWIVSVPLHSRRLAERGFNQSALIASEASKLLNKKYMNNLFVRVRYTKIQARLKREDRVKSIKDAFALEKEFDIKGKNILLIDDVFTTGGTLQECAKLLKQSGAKNVIGLSIARG